MSTELKELRTQQPMTADALVNLANDFLSQRGATLVSKRTLRFYTAQDVVPSPMGSPKFARYGYEHLLSLLAARSLQDQGMRLEEIRRETSEIMSGRLERIETRVSTWLEGSRGGAISVMQARETSHTPFSRLAQLGTATLRLPLAPNVQLELGDSANILGDLEKAQKALGRILEEAKQADSST